MIQLLEEYHFWTMHNYIELRNITATRLTLPCGRRGSELCRILLNKWKEADSDLWTDQQRLKALRPSAVMLVKHLKITYMAGKGNRYLVPILLQPGTVPSLKKLAGPEVQGSGIHVSGSHVLKDICKNVTPKNLDIIKVTSQRLRVSTLFAVLDLLQQDLHLFYRHMGQSNQKIKTFTRRH